MVLIVGSIGSGLTLLVVLFLHGEVEEGTRQMRRKPGDQPFNRYMIMITVTTRQIKNITIAMS